MDPRLLEYYNRELSYLRETGAEFATLHPKIAARLGMQGTDIADPYVERMIEAFSFLSARTQLKIDAEFPRFTQRLLEVVSPNYVTPTPSMAVVKLYPDTQEGDLAKGVTVPRDTAVRFPHPGRRKYRLPVSQQPGRHAVAAVHRGGTPDRRAAGYARPAPLSAA